jgi:hypothetical protein
MSISMRCIVSDDRMPLVLKPALQLDDERHNPTVVYRKPHASRVVLVKAPAKFNFAHRPILWQFAGSE